MKVKSVIKNEFRNMTKENLTEVLKELTERFCERIDEAERCSNNLNMILDSLVCTGKRNISTTDLVEIDLEVAEGAAIGDAVSLVEDAIRDDDDYIDNTVSSSSSGIPAERRCFVPGTIRKCKMLGVNIRLCQANEAQACEPQEVQGKSTKKAFLLSCPTCIQEEILDKVCQEKVSQICDKTSVQSLKWDASKTSLCP